MVRREKKGTLSSAEKRIVKALLNQGERNQDIQALVNIGRPVTINSARITEVKKSTNQSPATENEVRLYKKTKRTTDLVTGLNPHEHERLIRAREAMVLAVQVFNSPSVIFKTEAFSVLAVIAWTYLLHEYYCRKKISIWRKSGNKEYSLSLTEMIRREDCPITKGMKKNLEHIYEIREKVEHKLFEGGDPIIWGDLFQACCLNFDKVMCKNFGDKLTLTRLFSYALQFSRMDLEQSALLSEYEIPPLIKAINANLHSKLSEEERNDLEYRYQVVFTLTATSKNRAHINFINPDSEQGKKISNVLVKEKIADELYPYKPLAVVKKVCKITSKPFNMDIHTKAWKKFEVRPKQNASNPDSTNKKFCIYHKAHGDYTYSDEWVEKLVALVNAGKTRF